MNRSYRLVSAFAIVLVCSFAWGQKIPDVPPGTTLRVRVDDKLSSEETQIGDTFHGTLDEPVMVGGRELFPKGADVNGRVTDVHKSGRLSEPGELDLVVTTLSTGRIATSIQTQPLVVKGGSHTKSNATKIGGGAALGAVIGAIAGGGKGAAIGTVVGGAGGGAAAAATGVKPAIVNSETVLSFTTSSASSATAASEPPPVHHSDDEPTLHRSEPPAGNPPANQTDANAVPPPAQTEPAPPSTPADSGAPLFTLRDRRIIRNCVSQHTSDFSSDALQRPELPGGDERQIRRGGNLPPDADKKAQSLPLACEQQLAPLPKDLDRVVYNGRVLLIDEQDQVLDVFALDDTQ